MTHDELRAAQEKLGLSQTQLARVLRIDARSYRRLIAGDRAISGPVSRVIEALLDGWRPQDWPRERAHGV